MIRTLLRSLFATVVALCVLVPSQAQRLQGTVQDPSGAVVRGASVTLLRDGTGVVQGTTSVNGVFELSAPAAGHYVLQVRASGFADLSQVVIVDDKLLPLNLKLSLPGTQAQVTVSADDPGVRPEDTGTKLGLSAIESPVSLEMVTRDTLESRAVVDLDQAVDTISGIQRAPGFPFQTGYFIRGFFDSYDTLHDGFRDYTGSADVSNIDHVEVLKGSPSVDYGTVATGGILNVVTKTPSPSRFGSAQFDVANYGFYRTTVDLNAPLHGGKLLGRINLAYRNAGSFREFLRDDNYFVAPALVWKPTAHDTVVLKNEFNHLDLIFPSDFPYDQIFTTLPIEFSVSEPHLGGSRNNILREELDCRHTFNDRWEAREAFAATNQFLRIGQERVYNTDLGADGHTLNRTVSSGPQNSLNYTSQQELYGKAHGLGLSHQMAFGVEGYRERYNYVNNFAALAPLDLLHPVYGAKPGLPSPGLNGSYGSDDIGLYAQDYIGFASRWHLFAAGRFDGNDTLSIDYLGNSRSDVHSHQFSPRLALSYQPAAQTSVYFDWSRSFLPNFGTNAANQAFKPVIGEQYELGAKRGFLDQHLLGTLALYQIAKQNVLTPDLTSPQFSVQTGEQRSRGVEATVQGQIFTGLKTTAAYAYTYADVTRDNSIPIGSLLADVPRNQFSVWTTYRLPFSSVRGIGVGFGDFYASRREASVPSTFLLSSYNRIDAAVSYDRERWRASVNLKNLTSTSYYDVDGGYGIRPNAPLTVLGSIRKEF